MITKRRLKVLGVGGYARSGKDTFYKVASKILNQNGYTTVKLAFADELKKQVADALQNTFPSLNVYTDDTEQKNLIRPMLVWWGCTRRILSPDGLYWVQRIDDVLESYALKYADTNDAEKLVFVVTDVRFPNESKWLHQSWDGWMVHLKKFKIEKRYGGEFGTQLEDTKIYDPAPNEEEAKQDPLIQVNADYRLELENVVEREKRNGNIISAADLTDNSYLNEEINLCLSKCPFLTIQTQ